jgi:hypothetical protein
VLGRAINSKKDQILYDKTIPMPSPAVGDRNDTKRKQKADKDYGSSSVAEKIRKKLISDSPGLADRKPFSPVPSDSRPHSYQNWLGKHVPTSNNNHRLTLDPFAVRFGTI